MPQSGMNPGTPPPVSYEFRLTKPSPDGISPAPAHHSATDSSSGNPCPEKEALKRRVAEKLMAHSPQLRLYQFPYDQIARFEQIPQEEAHRKYRQLELNGPEDGHGIQIVLWDDEASLTVPFWHDLEKSALAFRELWPQLNIICQEAGYTVYDPQLGQLVDLATGFDTALAHYLATARNVRNALPINGAPKADLRTTPAAPAPNSSQEIQFPSIRQLAASEDSRAVLVAVQPTGAVCGYAEVCIRRDHGTGASTVPVACLESWHVAPGLLQHEVGQELLASVEQWALARGLRELASEVALDNEQSVRAHLAGGFAERRRMVHFTKLLSVRVSFRNGIPVTGQPLTSRAASPASGEPKSAEPTSPALDVATAMLCTAGASGSSRS